MIADRQLKIVFAVIVGYLGTSCSMGLSQTTREYKTFAEWCENLSQLSAEQKHTVEMLLKEVGTRECNAASQKLTELTELRLPVKGIADIKPLSNLTDLTKLSLSNSRISEIEPLSNLTDLTELDLSSNPISDLKSLTNLTALVRLDLSKNQIADLKPLSNLTNLTELYLLDKPIADRSCTLQPASICRF
jgi:internalin A